MSEVIDFQTPKSVPLTWLDVANKEIAELQEAAKASPKTFFGNRTRGIGAGLTRVKALHSAAKNIVQALSALDRVL